MAIEPPIKHTRGSEDLDRLLDEEGKDARALRERFHRTLLWRYRTGRRQPDGRSMVSIAELSRGRIPAKAWTEPARAAARRAVAEKRGCKACGRA